jgi:hypothetical protein
MMKNEGSSQLEAVSHIKHFLAQKGLNLPSRCVEAGNDADWLVFERGGRCIGVDPQAGVWRKDSSEANWQTIEKPCAGGGALIAADFLAQN